MAQDAGDAGARDLPAVKAAVQQAAAALDFATVERLTRRALRDFPANADLWSAHAEALDELDRIAEAAAAFERAAALAPDDPARRNDYAMNRLKLGFLAEGFRAYEARLALFEGAGGLVGQLAHHRRWDGAARERVIVCGEQGFGDQIMFARFIPQVAARARAVTVVVRPALVSLFGRRFDVVRPSAPGSDSAALPAFDSWVPMGSLPALLGCHADAALDAEPYLAADPARIARWAPAIDRRGLAVGLAWSGNPAFPRNHRRALPSAALYRPLVAVPGVRCYGLQMPPDPVAPDWLDDLAPRIADFDDTAAILENLDLLITTDTAIAHLAGALGRPVWLLLSRVADWRWRLEGADSVWYRSMRLFRQPTPGDWGAVIGEVERALRARASAG